MNETVEKQNQGQGTTTNIFVSVLKNTCSEEEPLRFADDLSASVG